MPVPLRKIPALVAGASGYTGAETVRLLADHPHFDVVALVGDRSAGSDMADIYPHMRALNLPHIVKADDVDWQGIEAAFICLPHGASQRFVASVPENVRVFDLSADFRLEDVETYAKWYGKPHEAPQLQPSAVYGLTEHARREIKRARLVACPGCYPTATALPLYPLLAHGAIEPEGIIVDAKSGVSGAGRGVKEANLFCEIEGAFFPYGVGAHRHTPEIEQTLSRAAGKKASVHFTPQIVPTTRGLTAVCYVRIAKNATIEDVYETLDTAYKDEPFIHVLPYKDMPNFKQVRLTNNCLIGVAPSPLPGLAVVVGAIDNLLKGAAGQALQNANLVFNVEETVGLPRTAAYP